MRLAQESDGRFTRDALDAIFHVNVRRREKRRRMLAENRAQRKRHLAAKRAARANA